MNRTHALLTTLAVSASLGLTACGGDDEPAASSSSAAAPTISTADFTTQANAVCAAGNEELATAAQALGDDPSQEEIEAFATETLIPNVQGQHDDIEALGLPDGAEEDVSALLASLQDAIDAVTAEPGSLTADTDPFAEANDLAGALGLTDCAS